MSFLLLIEPETFIAVFTCIGRCVRMHTFMLFQIPQVCCTVITMVAFSLLVLVTPLMGMSIPVHLKCLFAAMITTWKMRYFPVFEHM